MARDPPPPLQLSKGGGERSLGQIIHYRVKLIPPPPCSTAGGGEETKELMRQKALGRKHSEETLLKMTSIGYLVNIHEKCDSEGFQLIGSFVSIRRAGKFLGISSNTVRLYINSGEIFKDRYKFTSPALQYCRGVRKSKINLKNSELNSTICWKLLKPLGTIKIINICFISDNPKGCTMDYQQEPTGVFTTLVGSSETTRGNLI